MLVKTVNYESNYQLPVYIITKKGYIKKYRFYSNENDLMKAYRQLKAINGFIKPLYPVIYDNVINI